MKRILPLLLLILIVLTGCNADSIKTPIYQGISLAIGVIGESPKVREDNIEFTTITFNELEEFETLSSRFNAIFIMKEYLSEAAESKYAKPYKNAGIPFFFIQSEKSFLPFIIEDLSYEEVDLKIDEYAIGYYKSNTKSPYQDGHYWGFGLYNSKINETNIKSCYSEIFTLIESLKDNK